MNPVSMFASAHATAPKDCDPAAVVNAIRTGKWRNPVESVRSAYATTYTEALARGDDHKAAVLAAKKAVADAKKRLPGCTFSGTFSKRGNDALLAHSGLLCADLDDLDAEALASCRATLAQSPHVWSVFTSPTGSGLKCVFRVPADGVRHADSFAAVRDYVREKCAVEIDDTPDCARLCFISYDPAATLNEAAAELPVAEAEPAEPTPPPKRPAAEPSKPATPPDLERRLAIARELFGPIDSATKPPRLFVKCPGISSHTNGDAPADCELHLAGAPNLSCLHNSCRDAVEAASRELQSRIGKAEYAELEAEVQRLAALPPLVFDREAKAFAQRSGIKLSTLAREVAKVRAAAAAAAEPTGPAEPKPAEPWPEAVDGAELLADIAATYRRFCHLPPHAAEVLAAWILQTYCFREFQFVAVVVVWSPEPECGKGRVLEVTAALAWCPFVTANTSAPVLYHSVAKGDLTVLVDEIDSQNDDQRAAIFNVMKSGFQANGKSHRMAEVDGKQTVVEFATYSPKMAAAIGLDLFDRATRSRAIGVRMQRKPRSVKLAKFRRYDGSEIQRRCLRWVQDNREALRKVGPLEIAEAASDRQEDVWEPLVAIARVAGGAWESRIRGACVALSGKATAGASEGVNHTILRAVRDYFATGETRVPTKTLMEALNADEDLAGVNKGRGLTPSYLARCLKPYGVEPRNLKLPDGRVCKGYDAGDFADVFATYLTPTEPEKDTPPPEPPLSSRYSATEAVNIDQNPLFEAATEPAGSVSENAIPINKDGAGSGVAAKNAEIQEELL